MPGGRVSRFMVTRDLVTHAGGLVTGPWSQGGPAAGGLLTRPAGLVPGVLVTLGPVDWSLATCGSGRELGGCRLGKVGLCVMGEQGSADGGLCQSCG